MCDAIWNNNHKNGGRESISDMTNDLSIWNNIQKGNIVPSTHCSDSILLPSGLLPLYFPMQMPACRTVLDTVPPQSWISSTKLWVGGWECWDTNMVGWLWNRSCWCSPADRCLWRRQIWEENGIVELCAGLVSCSVPSKHLVNKKNRVAYFLSRITLVPLPGGVGNTINNHLEPTPH